MHERRIRGGLPIGLLVCLLAMIVVVAAAGLGCGGGPTNESSGLQGVTNPGSASSLPAQTTPSTSIPTTDSSYPVLNELPPISLEDVGLVRIRSAYPPADRIPPGFPAPLSAFPLRVLSPGGDAQTIKDLLAAYEATRLRPEEGTRLPQDTAVYLDFVLKDGSYVAVNVPGGSGDAAVWYWARGLAENGSASPHAFASTPELVSLAKRLTTAPSPDFLPDSALPAEMPADFGFVLTYTPLGRSVIDTFSGTFTKDLIRNPEGETITMPLELSSKELTTIYRALAGLDLAVYSAEYRPPQAWSDPLNTYYFRFRVGGEEKEIYWEDRTDTSSPDAVALRTLFKQIRAMVETKPEYKALPPAVGGYS